MVQALPEPPHRSTVPSLKDTDLRCCLAHRGKDVASGSLLATLLQNAPQTAVSLLPFQTPHSLFLVVTRTLQLSPQISFACSFCNTATDTREGGLLGGQPAPCAHILSKGKVNCREIFFPFLASIPLARTGKMNQTGKQAKGIYELLTRAHWSDLLAQEVLHMLRKSKRMKWGHVQKEPIRIPIPEIEQKRTNYDVCSYCCKPCYIFP